MITRWPSLQQRKGTHVAIRARHVTITVSMICFLESSNKRPFIALCFFIQAWRTTNHVIRVHQDLWGELEDVSVVVKITALERYNIKSSIQKKTQSLEQYHAKLVKIASEADWGDRGRMGERYVPGTHVEQKDLQGVIIRNQRTQRGVSLRNKKWKRNIAQKTTARDTPALSVIKLTSNKNQLDLSTNRGTEPRREKAGGDGMIVKEKPEPTRTTRTNCRTKPTSKQTMLKSGNPFSANHLQTNKPSKRQNLFKVAEEATFRNFAAHWA